RVYVVTSLAGGSGSGMFIDLAYLLRKTLSLLGYNDPEIVGLFLVPTLSGAPTPEAAPGSRGPATWTPPNPAQTARTQARGNTYAAWTDRKHFSAPHTRYMGRYDLAGPGKPGPVDVSQPPFTRGLLLPLPEGETSVWRPDGEAAEVVQPPAVQRTLAQAARYLVSELTMPMGKNAAVLRE